MSYKPHFNMSRLSSENVEKTNHLLTKQVSGSDSWLTVWSVTLPDDHRTRYSRQFFWSMLLLSAGGWSKCKWGWGRNGLWVATVPVASNSEGNSAKRQPRRVINENLTLEGKSCSGRIYSDNSEFIYQRESCRSSPTIYSHFCFAVKSKAV